MGGVVLRHEAKDGAIPQEEIKQKVSGALKNDSSAVTTSQCESMEEQRGEFDVVDKTKSYLQDVTVLRRVEGCGLWAD